MKPLGIFGVAYLGSGVIEFVFMFLVYRYMELRDNLAERKQKQAWQDVEGHSRYEDMSEKN